MIPVLLAIGFGGAVLTYLSGKISPRARNVSAVLISLAEAVIVALLYKTESSLIYFSFLDNPLILRANALSWFFASAVSVLGLFSVIFSLSYMKGRERADTYYMLMLLVNAAMLGLVFSGDMISFYIFWEIMSWSAFLLISYKRGPALKAAMKYIIMSVAGSVCLLAGILLLHSAGGSFDMSALASVMAGADEWLVILTLTLFSIAFGIKSALWPLHTWLPPAHSEAPSPFSAILSGVMIKMGVFGFILMIYVMLSAGKSFEPGNFHRILCALAVIAAVIPNFIAVFQDDAKKLLAWSSAGQVGYMLLGIASGTQLGLAGGIFHFFNHAFFKALLFFSAGAVEHRTGGVRDMNSLGGFVKVMPVTFAAALIGALGLIGAPLTNGFVSKWLIYKALILDGRVFLALGALAGTWGSILSLYKFLHHIFLGQLPEKYKKVEEAPPGMRFPMLALGAAVIIFGVVPGIPLTAVNGILVSFGYGALELSVWGIASETGALNTVNIFFALAVMTSLVCLFFRKSGRQRRVSQDDSYAAGLYVPAEKYNYTAEFYGAFFRMAKPYLTDRVDDFYGRLNGKADAFGEILRKFYTGDVGDYAMYILGFAALLIVIAKAGGVF